jgi:hypothetical protein
MVVGGPGWLVRWTTPGAETAPSFDSFGRKVMIIGGVMLVLGSVWAWRIWRRPN